MSPERVTFGTSNQRRAVSQHLHLLHSKIKGQAYSRVIVADYVPLPNFPHCRFVSLPRHISFAIHRAQVR
jgi:hypothetical protein